MQSQELIKGHFNGLDHRAPRQLNNEQVSAYSVFIIDQKIKKKQSETNPKTCPFCCGHDIKEGIKLETDNSVLRDSSYIEYFCLECGHYFLV